MEFDEFTIVDNGDGGFIARKSSRKGQELAAFMGLTEFRATPMGRELVVACDFGVLRVMRNIMVALLILIGVAGFITYTFDPPKAYEQLIAIFTLLGAFVFTAMICILVFTWHKRKARRSLERLLKAAVDISEMP